MYASAKMKSMGMAVKVLNYNLWDYDLKAEIKGQDLVGFTGFEEFLPYIKRDAEICKEMGIKTILGGALATFKPEEMKKYVTFVEQGEYDFGIDVCPDYDGFGIDEYHRRHSNRYMGILTSRGCPYHCTFCAQTCKFRMRNLVDVFSETDYYIYKYKIKTIIFNDNTLNLTKERFIDICHSMRQRRLSWGAAIRVVPWDEEMAFAASEGGCQYLVVGVESFNQARLDMMNKQVTVDQITRCLDILNHYKIGYSGNILVGFENDTFQDITIEVNSIPGRFKVFPTLVQPFIGTKNGHTRKIDKEQVDFLTSTFREYVESCGKYLYPAIPEGGLQ
jgi:radical SAM superfamily enzyme YgiQ (UPF0313 family)